MKKPTRGTSKKTDPQFHIKKEVAGGATGALLGAAVAGPVGALIGGLVGTAIGNAAAKEPLPQATKNMAKAVRRSKATKAVKRGARKIISNASKVKVKARAKSARTNVARKAKRRS